MLSDLAEEIERNVNKIDNDLIALKTLLFWLLILAFVLFLIRLFASIAKPVDKAIEVAERIAARARNVVIEIQSKDKLGKLLLSLNKMQESIRKNEEVLRMKEEESRVLFENLLRSSERFRENTAARCRNRRFARKHLDIDENDILQYDLGQDLNLMTDGLASITKKITQVSNEIVRMVGTALSAANEQGRAYFSSDGN